MRYHFVVNPRASRVRYEKLSSGIAREFRACEYRITAGLPLGADFRDPETMVVAVGGDGTVNRVVNAVGEGAVPIGLIPRGTANDLARALAIPTDLRGACAVLRSTSLVEVDLARVANRYFITGGGLGLGARIAERVNAVKAKRSPPSGLIRLCGPWAYSLAAIAELTAARESIRARITTRGRTREANLAALLVSNQSCLGGRFSPSPSASNQDGFLDLCAIEDPGSRARMARICWEVLCGRPGARPEIQRDRIREMRVVTSRDTPFFGDGEILACGREFAVSVRPAAIRVAVPPKRRIRCLVTREANRG
jgi:YegS/Rv2252/BmrU family lipid kinase